MRRGPSLLLAGLAILAQGLLGAAPALAQTGGEEPAPQLQLDVTELAVGQTVPVRLTGWPAGLVSVELCGGSATRGSADCAVSTGLTVVVDDSGAGTGELVAARPPVDCPCVVRGRTLAGGVLAVQPVVLTGADVAVPADPGEGGASAPEDVTGGVGVLVTTAIDDPDGWWGHLRAALGGPLRRDVTLSVRNVDGRDLEAGRLEVRAGRNGLSGAVLAEVELDPLPAGQERTYTIPLTVRGPALGHYVVFGHVPGTDQSGDFAAEATTWPYLGAGLLVLVVAWIVVRRADRRADRRGLPLLRALAVTLGLAAVTTVGYGVYSRWSQEIAADRAQGDLLSSFARPLGRSPELTTPLPSGDAPVSGDGTGAGAAARVPAPAIGDLVGVLRIPALGGDHQVAVVEGVTPEQLRRAPGHYPGTALPGQIGNAVVAGHNARTGAGAPFADLDELGEGDEIRWETSAGTWTYRVTGTRVVAPTATSVLLPVRDVPDAEPTEAVLTLITCDYSQGRLTQRLIVEATLATGGSR